MQARPVVLQLGRSTRHGCHLRHIGSIVGYLLRLQHQPCPIAPPVLHHPPLRRPHIRPQSTSSQVPALLSDPSRPDLFYHLVSLPRLSHPSQSPPMYALSFLPTPPPSGRSRTIIGWLPAVAEGGNEDVEAGLNDFVENRTYGNILRPCRLLTLPRMNSQRSSDPSCMKQYSKLCERVRMTYGQTAPSSFSRDGCTSTVCLICHNLHCCTVSLTRNHRQSQHPCSWPDR
jgi:hypothetical protein